MILGTSILVIGKKYALNGMLLQYQQEGDDFKILFEISNLLFPVLNLEDVF
jgi:hypothetical protein